MIYIVLTLRKLNSISRLLSLSCPQALWLGLTHWEMQQQASVQRNVALNCRGEYMSKLNLKLSDLKFGVFWNCISLSTRKSSNCLIKMFLKLSIKFSNSIRNISQHFSSNVEEYHQLALRFQYKVSVSWFININFQVLPHVTSVVQGESVWSHIKISEAVYSLSGFWNCLFWKRQTTGSLFIPVELRTQQCAKRESMDAKQTNKNKPRNIALNRELGRESMHWLRTQQYAKRESCLCKNIVEKFQINANWGESRFLLKLLEVSQIQSSASTCLHTFGQQTFRMF